MVSGIGGAMKKYTIKCRDCGEVLELEGVEAEISATSQFTLCEQCLITVLTCKPQRSQHLITDSQTLSSACQPVL